MELDPFGVLVSLDMFFTLTWQGKYEAAKDLSRKALDLDPTNPYAQWGIGWTDIEAEKFSEAIPELQKAATMEAPPVIAAWLGYAYGASGDRTHAMAMLEELHRRSVHGHVAPFKLAIVYLGMGDRQRALDYAEQAYSAHSQWLCFLKMDHIYDPLRKEPRFIALMKKLHFHQ